MQKINTFWKTFISLFAVLLGIVLILFLGLFAYYSFQLKFGDPDTLKNLTRTYEDQFSSTSGDKAPTVLTNWKDLIQPNNPTLGNAQADITIITFIDFTCQYCKNNFPLHKYLEQKYSPIIQIVFKHLPLTIIHEYAYISAEAASCADEQNKFWQYYDNLFKTNITDENILFQVATKTGLNIEQFNTCFSNHSHMAQIEQDVADAMSVGLRGTPTHIINGEVVEGILTKEEWDTLILKYLNQ